MTPIEQGVVSSCCGAVIYENTDVCSDCKEHCTAQSEPEYFGELTWLDEDWKPEKVTYNGKEIR